MAETQIIIKDLSINYEGLFTSRDLYRLIDTYFADKGYDKREVLSMEKVEPSGKYVEIELEPYKKISDYAKLVVRIYLKIFNLKDAEVEKEGHKIKTNQGKVDIRIDGLLVTDYEGRWEAGPTYVFIRKIYDKFIYKSYIDQYETQLSQDVNLLHTQIKSFLNLNRY